MCHGVTTIDNNHSPSVNYVSIYIIESVRLFVCLFAVNAKTTARIDAKRSGITKNDPESVLCVLKLPVLVFLGRYRDISGFSFYILSSVAWRKVRSMLMKELEERPKLGMIKEIVALELESSCVALKRKRDRRMMINLKRGHGSIPDTVGKVRRSGEKGEKVQGMPEWRG